MTLYCNNICYSIFQNLFYARNTIGTYELFKETEEPLILDFASLLDEEVREDVHQGTQLEAVPDNMGSVPSTNQRLSWVVGSHIHSDT